MFLRMRFKNDKLEFTRTPARSTNQTLSDIILAMYEFAVTPAVTSIRRRGVEIAEVSPESLGFELELESVTGS